MDKHPRRLVPEWRLRLEERLIDGEFSGERAELICFLLATHPAQHNYMAASQLLTEMLNMRKVSSKERREWYITLTEIWRLLTQEVSTHKLQVLHLTWQPGYDRLLAEHFAGTNCENLPAGMLLRLLRWIRCGRHVTKKEFEEYNPRPPHLDEEQFTTTLHKVWEAAGNILNSLPRQLGASGSSAASHRTRQNLVKLNAALVQSSEQLAQERLLPQPPAAALH